MRSAARGVALFVALLATATPAQEPQAQEQRRTDLEPKHGAALPLEARFVDEFGRDRPLRDWFDGNRPVLLTLNYYRCPMLCTKQLDAFVDGGDGPRYDGTPGGLRSLPTAPGEGYVVLTVSFDPLETHELAARKKKSYVGAVDRPGTEKGWHFLTGEKPAIDALCDAVGFHYAWVGEEYAHPPAVIACTPDGRVSDYAVGYNYDRATLVRLITRAAARKTTPAKAAPATTPGAPPRTTPAWLLPTAIALGLATFAAALVLIRRSRRG